MMYKNLLVIFTLFLSVYAASNPTVYDVNSPYLQVVTEELTPNPVEPGNDIIARIRVYNAGGGAAGNVSINVDARSPFYLKSESQNINAIKNLCIACSIDKSFYLSVNADAISGDYPLIFRILYDATVIEEELTVQVRGTPDIVFSTSSILSVAPSEQFTVEMVFENIGTGTARNIKITPNSKEFVIIGSNLGIIRELKPESKSSLELQFKVIDDVKPNTYSFPITTNFLDEIGGAYNFTQNIGINVLNKAQLSIKEVKIEPTSARPGDVVDIRVRIENTGEGDAENVKLYFESDFEGSKTSYIGRLEKEEDSPAFFSGQAGAIGESIGTLIITYDDDLGNHTIREELTYTSKGISSTSVIIWGLSALVLVLLGIIALCWIFDKCKCYLKDRKVGKK